jgi:hypothetical protein
MLRRRADAGDGEAQWSRGYVLMSEAGGGTGALRGRQIDKGGCRVGTLHRQFPHFRFRSLTRLTRVNVV